jgi:hypothetical protein
VSNAILSTLPPLPSRMRGLPVSDRGYPVPYFVAWLGPDGKPTPRGAGTPDFRVVHPGTIAQCHTLSLCWLCGMRLGSFRSFVIGPICALNRTSSEPPSHLECADYAARACPFLTRPKEKRNEHRMPEGHLPPSGHMILRNPGVALVWTVRKYGVFSDGEGGALFDVGTPKHVRWYCEGRPATRAEVLASIDSGLPLLEEAARTEDRPELVTAVLAEIRRRYETAMRLLPVEESP